MKIQTSIKPRLDGTVKVIGQDGQKYEFVADQHGELCCDVTHKKTVAHLVATGNFWPADESDFDSAIQLTKTETDATPEGSRPCLDHVEPTTQTKKSKKA